MGNLYKIINELCEEKGIKPGKMCTDIGVSRGLITDLKMGRKNGVTAETAQKFADYFGVTVGYLLGKEEKNAPADTGKRALGSDINLTQSELDLIHKFRRLDARGRSAVLHILDHEYTSITGEETISHPRQA